MEGRREGGRRPVTAPSGWPRTTYSKLQLWKSLITKMKTSLLFSVSREDKPAEPQLTSASWFHSRLHQANENLVIDGALWPRWEEKSAAAD